LRITELSAPAPAPTSHQREASAAGDPVPSAAAKPEAKPSPRVELPSVNGVPATACYTCHNKERFAAGGTFPHRMHFEEQELTQDCNACHQAKWHQSLGLSTKLCLDCHEVEELPIFTGGTQAVEAEAK